MVVFLLQEAVQAVDDIKRIFSSCLDAMVPTHRIRELLLSGSAAEGSHVVTPTDFDVLVMLPLDPHIWSLADAGPTLLAAHGYHMVKRTNLDYFSRGATAYDKYLVGDYLSPSKIKLALMDVVNRINWGSKFKVQPSVVGSEAKVQVFYGRAEPKKRLEVNFVPTVQFNGTSATATCHPQAESLTSYKNLWQDCYTQEDVRRLNSPTASSEEGCQLMCLQLLKAVKMTHPAQLGVLSNSSLKTTVLQAMDQETGDWTQGSLAERFMDCIRALEGFLRVGYMPHHINSKLNLLDGLNPMDLISASDFLAKIISTEAYSSLVR